MRDLSFPILSLSKGRGSPGRAAPTRSRSHDATTNFARGRHRDWRNRCPQRMTPLGSPQARGQACTSRRSRTSTMCCGRRPGARASSTMSSRPRGCCSSDILTIWSARAPTRRRSAGKAHRPIIDAEHRWERWAAPKKKDGSFDHDQALTGDDLIAYVNREALPLSQGLPHSAPKGANTIEYKIGEIFGEIENKFRSGYSLRDALELIDQLKIRHAGSRSTSCRSSTRPRSSAWAMPGGTAANITRRARSSAP